MPQAADTPAVPATPCKERAPEYVTRASLAVPFAKPWLGSEDDVEAYLDALKQTLLTAIREGKRIQI